MAEFQTEFAVSMTCEACVQDVRNVLKQQQDIQGYEIDLAEQRVVVTGKAPPSRISRALKDTGRQVIVRGTGTATGVHAGAAVCIFEAYTPPTSSSFDPTAASQQVHGIARMVQTSEGDDGVCVVDLTIKHEALVRKAQAAGTGGTLQALRDTNDGKVFPPPRSTATTDGAELKPEEMSKFLVYVAKSGDISEGARSAGGVQRAIGEVEVNPATGYGDLFVEVPRLKVWEMIGHAMVVAPVLPSSSKVGEGILAGVIARSAGAWGNDKKVCACSGQTMWEENRLTANL